MAELMIDERVALGAAWLDEVVPGWEERIDPETLDLGDEYACICGQLWGEAHSRRSGWRSFRYDHLFNEAFAWLEARGELREGTEFDLGFNRAYDGETFNDLTFGWRRLLAERGVTARDALTTTGGRGNG